jgi:hypothetical protein
MNDDPRPCPHDGRHQHGQRATYVVDRCRCTPCKAANARYEQDRTTRAYLLRGGAEIDSTGTRRRVRALERMGWPIRTIAADLGVTSPAVRAWIVGERVRRDTAARVAALYDRYWATPGPSRRAALLAEAAGWPPPLAWDDDSIDDPAARPHRDAPTPAAFDEVAVQRAMRGDPVHLRPVERGEAVRRLTALRYSAADIAARLDVTTRSVVRHRGNHLEETA